MKYSVVFDDDIDQEEVEFHAVSHDVLRSRVKDWMYEDGRFTEGEVFSEDGRYLFTLYL